MVRRQTKLPPPGRDLGEVWGITSIGVALLFLVALFSHDSRDLSLHTIPPNETIHNLIGPFGAHLANGLFFLFGGAAFLVPPLMIIYGLAFFSETFAYLRRRWPWAVVLVFACMGVLAVYFPLFGELARNLNTPNPGGFLGQFLDQYVFSHFGRVGATIILGVIYSISFLYITNFDLKGWVEDAWRKWQVRRELALKAAAEKASAKGNLAVDPYEAIEGLPDPGRNPRSRRRRKALPDPQESVTEAAPAAARAKPEPELEPELEPEPEPEPEPVVRDHSMPQPRRRPEPEPDVEAEEDSGRFIESEVVRAVDLESESEESAPKGRTRSRGKEVPADAEAASAPTEEVPDGVTITDTQDPDQETVVSPEAESVDGVASASEEEEPPPPKPKPAAPRAKPIEVASTPKIVDYRPPGMQILQEPDLTTKPAESKDALVANARLIQNTLSQFGIQVSLGDITRGPTITRYELHPAPGVKLEKIVNLTNNLTAALKAERIHILAPVPGKSSVGVEVPNAVKTKVIMRDLLESDEWTKSRAKIPLALGKDVYGHAIIADLAEMPHLLIAGSTGSGKSVCINSVIASLLYKFAPDDLRFVMIDPKVVELQQYNSLPHLVVPVVTDPKKVILALRWVVNEMEKRYQIFARVGVRNIHSFNNRSKKKAAPKPPDPELPLTVNKENIEAGAEGFAVELDEEIIVPREDDIIIPEKLSYIVVIVDELADLMLVAPADVEMAIARITQMARAAGIHCIIATQRPSVDVITGVIKANIPARIAFQVASKVDSRTILDAMGADKLLGKGDMLYLPPGSARLIRAQGVLITDEEIQAAVDHIARQGQPSYEMEIHQQLSKPVSSLDDSGGGGGTSDQDEELIEKCIEVIRTEQKASVSMLQRRLRLGYTRAARIMDELENRGVVGPSKGAEPREILIDLDLAAERG